MHTDEVLLGNTLAACNLLWESMSRLRGHFCRDYLVEMIQNHPTGMGNAPASQAFPNGSLYRSVQEPSANELGLLHDWLVPPLIPARAPGDGS